MSAEIILERPLTRSDCLDGPRPCPWVSCRHHLLLESAGKHVYVQSPVPRGGHPPALKEDMSEDEVSEALERLEDTCSLDVADRGEHTMDQVGQLLGISKQRVEQAEKSAMGAVRRLTVLRESLS